MFNSWLKIICFLGVSEFYRRFQKADKDFGTLDKDCLMVDFQELRHVIKDMSWGPERLNTVSQITLEIVTIFPS